MDKENSHLTPEKVVKILKKHGTTVTSEEAKNILEFYKKFVNLWLIQVFKS